MRTAVIYMLMMLLSARTLPGASRQSNQQQFKVTRNGQAIGILNTSQIVEGGRVTYLLHSNVKLDVVFKVSITENISGIYENGILVKALQKRTINGKVKSENTTTRNGQVYTLGTGNQAAAAQLSEIITQSILSLYYREPRHGDRIYSESHQQVLAMQQVAPGRYCIELPNGSTSTYIYENGQLHSVESQTTWGTIAFTRN